MEEALDWVDEDHDERDGEWLAAAGVNEGSALAALVGSESSKVSGASNTILSRNADWPSVEYRLAISAVSL